MTYRTSGRSSLLGLSGAIGEEMGIDPHSHAASISGGRVVPTVWTQRALNAAGIRIPVTGYAARATLNAMNSYYGRHRSGPAPALQEGDPHYVFMSSAMEANLSLNRRVADPPRASSSSSSSSAPAATTTPGATTMTTGSATASTAATTSSGTSSGGKAPGSGPTLGPDDLPPITQKDIDYETSGGMSAWLPWAIGGAAGLAAITAIALIATRRKKPTANRRRR